jgi:hypothetical protein
MEECFIEHFEYEGTDYMIDVKPFYTLREEEKEQYHIREGDYLVHLFSSSGFKSFRMFTNEELYWTTDADKYFVDKDLVELIGSIIDEKNFLGGSFHP